MPINKTKMNLEDGRIWLPQGGTMCRKLGFICTVKPYNSFPESPDEGSVVEEDQCGGDILIHCFTSETHTD